MKARKFRGRPLWMQQSKRFMRFWFWNSGKDWCSRAYDSIGEFAEQFGHIPRGV